VVLQALQESEQFVVGSIPSGFPGGGCGHVQNPLLQLQVGIEVDLRGLDRLVPEPEGDHGTIDAVLEQVHRRRVAKHVGRHALLVQ